MALLMGEHRSVDGVDRARCGEQEYAQGVRDKWDAANEGQAKALNYLSLIKPEVLDLLRDSDYENLKRDRCRRSILVV